MPAISTIDRMIFIAGPATAISARCHRGFDKNSSGSPLRSSSGLSPAIFTYPTRGNHADAEGLGDDEVTPFVHEDHDPQHDGHGKNRYDKIGQVPLLGLRRGSRATFELQIKLNDLRPSYGCRSGGRSFH